MLRPTAIAYIFAMMMLSLCKTYWQIMLTQGVLLGICLGMLLSPAVAAVSQYFQKKRAAALGIAISGSSVGGVVFPIALSKMLNGTSLGFGWSIRILGFLIMPFMVFACVTVKARLPSRKTDFWIAAAFRNIKFNLLVLATFFMFFGMLTPFFYLPTYAVSQGLTPTLAGYLLAILNGASTFGRIIPGILGDKYGRLNAAGVGGILTAVVVFCFDSVHSTAGFVLYAAAFGFTSGSIISGTMAAFSLCPENARDIGTYMGVGEAFGAIATLIGPPINGALLNTYHGFLPSAMFSGALCTVGGLIMLASKATTPQGLLGRV
jgi:MFS family permease